MMQHHSKRQGLAISVILLGSYCLCGAGETTSISYDPKNPMLVFAVKKNLRQVLLTTDNRVTDDRADTRFIFEIFPNGMGSQAFRIRKGGQRGYRIIGGDLVEVMYGGLELAKQIRLDGSLVVTQGKARKPYILRSGLKFNIPQDARASSYYDIDTAAHKNIVLVWEFDFCKKFLDNMIYNRYNVMTLWTSHPYPGMVKLSEYPDANYDDVR